MISWNACELLIIEHTLHLPGVSAAVWLRVCIQSNVLTPHAINMVMACMFSLVACVVTDVLGS